MNSHIPGSLPSAIAMRRNRDTQLDQLATDRHQLRMIELEASYRGPTRRRLSVDFAGGVGSPFEVIMPMVVTGVEQSDDIAGYGIGRVDVSPFAIVAVRASVSQVVPQRLSASGHRNNMVDFKAANVQAVGKPAIFTALGSSLANTHPQLMGNSGHQLTATSGSSPTSSGATSCNRLRTFRACSFCRLFSARNSWKKPSAALPTTMAMMTIVS